MAKKTTPEGEKVIRTVTVKLSDAEKAKKADLLAELQLEKTAIEEEKKAATSGFTTRIKTIVKSLNKLAREVNAGSEERSEECIMVKDYDANEIQWWLNDEIVDRREMTAEDRQLDLEAQQSDYKDAKPGKKKRKTQLEVLASQTPQEDVADVIKEETSRRTKRSSVDGAYDLN